MKNIKRAVRLGVMAIMFNMMVTKVEAATYNGYTYSTDGESTSIEPIVEKDIEEYVVEEKDVATGEVKDGVLADYIVGETFYYPIPGLDNTNVLGENCKTMIPQGICRMDNYILITAYDKDKKCKAVIYVLTLSGRLEATLVYDDENSHMGGIAYDGKAIWIVEGRTKKVGVIKKENILGAIDVSLKKRAKSVKLKKVEKINPTGIENTSYCTYFDGMIWIGTHKEDALSDIYGYKVTYGTATTIVKKRYIQAPKKTQGITFASLNKEIYMAISTSLGRNSDSVIRCYKIKEYYEPKQKYNGVWQIKKGDAYRTLTLPSMAEQITTYGAYMYYVSESGARPYVDGSDSKEATLEPNGYFCIFSTQNIFK